MVNCAYLYATVHQLELKIWAMVIPIWQNHLRNEVCVNNHQHMFETDIKFPLCHERLHQFWRHITVNSAPGQKLQIFCRVASAILKIAQTSTWWKSVNKCGRSRWISSPYKPNKVESEFHLHRTAADPKELAPWLRRNCQVFRYELN